jgi:P4 family phage/plasmid primase-like protien
MKLNQSKNLCHTQKKTLIRFSKNLLNWRHYLLMSDNNNIFNDEADFWINKVGANPLPADSKNRTKFVKWKEYQDKSIPKEIINEWKQNGRFNDGIAIMTGLIHDGPYAGKYLNGIDCDNLKAIEEICTRDGKTITLQELANWTRVEQHKDNPDKAHIYILSTKPFKNKGKDPKFTELESKNEVPSIEIKCDRFTMFTAPSIHKNGYPYEVLGVKEPILCDASFEIHLDNIFKKYNIEYLQQSNNSYSGSKLPEELRKLVHLLEIPRDYQFRIHEGTRHNTLLSFANLLLSNYRFNTNVNNDELKTFFYEVNNKICVPEALPEDEIKRIWIDSLKNVNEKAERIKIEGDDENDTSTYRSQIVIQLDKGDKLLEKEFCQNLVYDIPTNNIDCLVNTKYTPEKRILQPINISKWPEVRKDFRKQCEEKGIEEEDILLLLDALDRNYDLIKKYYLEYYRKSNAALAAIEQRRQKKEQLVVEGTEFLLSTYTIKTIKNKKVNVNDIVVYNPNNGKFEYGGENLIGEELEKKYGYHVNTPIVNEIRDHIIRKTGVTKDRFDADPDIWNVKNGLLNIRTREIEPHRASYLSLVQLPVKFKKDAKAPKYNKFTNEVFYPDQIRTANEIIAYTLIRKNIYQYWIVFIGNGGNGKNVFIGIITALHGKENVSNVSLAHLGNLNLRFTLSQLENKNVNFDSELSAKSYNDLSTLKKLTDSQPIPIERKGKDPYDAELWANKILSCNKLPKSSDEGDGHYRREIHLPFPFQFVEQKDEDQKDDPNVKIADPFLLDKIIKDEDEMSGILNIALDALQSVYENEKIHTNSTISQRRERAELIADHVKGFYNENCKVLLDSTEYETKDDLHKAFLKFCQCKKLQIVSRKKFFDQLKEEYGTNEGRAEIEGENGKKHRPWVIFNIQLLTDEEKKKRDEQDDDDDGGQNTE